jgi:acyl-CoA thioesterase FadM
VTLDRIGHTSFTLAFDIYREPDWAHLADGSFVIATVSRGGFKAIPIPEELRKMLESFRETKGG